jgi:hypothetical protein
MSRGNEPLILFKVEILMVGMSTFVLFFLRGLEFEIVDIVE